MSDNNQPPEEARRDPSATADDPAASAGSSATLSRRSVLLAAAAAGTVAIPGRVRGSAGTRSAGTVAVGGAEPYRRLASAVVEEVRRERPDVAFAVRRTGFDRFLAGEIDAYLSDRPILPAERCRAAADGLSYEGREFAIGGAALVHEGGAWYDCVADTRLVGTWAGGAVATYAEVDADAARALGENPHVPAPGDAERVVVRGTRPFQYDRGHGGLGYYEPSAGVVRPLADGGGPGGDGEGGTGSRTPLVRLAYLYVNRESARRPAVAALERVFRAVDARGTGGVDYAADPTGLTR